MSQTGECHFVPSVDGGLYLQKVSQDLVKSGQAFERVTMYYRPSVPRQVSPTSAFDFQ